MDLHHVPLPLNLNIALFITAAILALATLLPLSRSKQWWIRAWDFPRLQIVTLSVAWILCWVILLIISKPASFMLLAIVLPIALYQARWIYPYTRLSAHEAPDATIHNTNGTTVSLIVSNVLMTNRHSQKLKSLINEYSPDVFATLETDQWWEDELDQISGYPYKLAKPLDNLYGMHLYSKLEFEDAQVLTTVEDDVPSMHVTLILANNERVSLHILHPKPPAPHENDISTPRDVELILLAQKLEQSTSKIIVAGDMNDVAWSATTKLFKQISGLFDIRVGRGMFNTFHAGHWYLRWPLDHVFTSKHFAVKKIARLPNIDSDHFPVYAELVLRQHSPTTTPTNDSKKDDKLLKETLNTSTADNASVDDIRT